jgi:hypothetical protein
MSTAAISSNRPSTAKVETPKARSQPTQAAASKTPASAPRSAQAASAAVSAATTALKEASETRTQTANEATKGDLQAQRLLAKENAAASARTGTAAKGSRINVKA